MAIFNCFKNNKIPKNVIKLKNKICVILISASLIKNQIYDIFIISRDIAMDKTTRDILYFRSLKYPRIIFLKHNIKLKPFFFV